jgi:3'(2'), 5'-bisphosphate nucleotidase
MTSPSPSPELSADHALASELAQGAGRLLLDLRAEMVADGAPPAELKAQGDRRSNDWLMERLAAERPGDAILSEEGGSGTGPSDTGRLGAQRVWIVDPLDGTREFSEPPRDDWAVHVALVVDGQPVVGAVALPAQGVVLSTGRPAPTPPSPPARPRVIVSRTRPPAVATFLADRLGGDLVEMGSAGAKASAVVQGRADVYPHAGGQYEWDSCAPVAVAAAAGVWTSRIDGSALVYNNADPYLPDLLVCHPQLVERVREALDAFDPPLPQS